MKLARLLVYDECPFVLVRNGPDAVASRRQLQAAHLQTRLRGDLRRPVRAGTPHFAEWHESAHDPSPVRRWRIVIDRDVLSGDCGGYVRGRTAVPRTELQI